MSILDGAFDLYAQTLIRMGKGGVLEHQAIRAMRLRARTLSPDDSLRSLFRMDDALYRLESESAIRYGYGTHTKHAHTHYHDFFVERIASGERVLDIGCGKGELTHDIAERAGAVVIGIDHRAEPIEAAKEQFAHERVTYLQDAAETYEPDTPFNTVILSNVLEHLRDRAMLLRHLTECTKARHFLLRVPVFERDWRVPLRKEVGAEWRLDETHEIEYTLESFAQEMEDADLVTRHQEVRWGEIWAEAIPKQAA